MISSSSLASIAEEYLMRRDEAAAPLPDAAPAAQPPAQLTVWHRGIDHVHHAGGRFARRAGMANRPQTC